MPCGAQRLGYKASMWIFDTSDQECGRKARTECLKNLASEAGRDELFEAEVIFGELLGNVVRHAPGTVNIWLDWIDGTANLYVHDYGPSHYWKMPHPGATDECGRGLQMARTLCNELVINRIPIKGTEVIAKLNIQRREAA